MSVYNTWEPKTHYSQGDTLCFPDGRQMVVITSGFSDWGTFGIDDPKWSNTIDEVVEDGEILWMCTEPKKTGYSEELIPSNPSTNVLDLFEEREI